MAHGGAPLDLTVGFLGGGKVQRVTEADTKRPAEPASPPDNDKSKHPKLSDASSVSAGDGMPSIMEIGGMMKHGDTCDKKYEVDASDSAESDYVDWDQIICMSTTTRPIETLSPDNDWLFSAAPSVSSGDDSLFRLANYIAPMVVKFLGVRSLVSFGATSKCQRRTMQNEVNRRKECIAVVEVEVTRLMASAKQSAKLSKYINHYIKTHSDSAVYDTTYEHLWEYLHDLYYEYKCLAEKNGEVTVSSITRENFIAAKKMVYNAMRLIDDEIGIFHQRLVTTDDWSNSNYYDIWEDVKLPKGPSCFFENEEIGPWSTGSPSIVVDGRREVIALTKRSDHDITFRLFRRERKKFYSRAQLTPRSHRSTVGPLFILPRCFYFSPRGEMSRMRRGAIKRACRWAY